MPQSFRGNINNFITIHFQCTFQCQWLQRKTIIATCWLLGAYMNFQFWVFWVYMSIFFFIWTEGEGGRKVFKILPPSLSHILFWWNRPCFKPFHQEIQNYFPSLVIVTFWISSLSDMYLLFFKRNWEIIHLITDCSVSIRLLFSSRVGIIQNQGLGRTCSSIPGWPQEMWKV